MLFPIGSHSYNVLAFEDQWLIGIEFAKSNVSCMSWTEIKSLKKNDIQSAFKDSKIIACKRNARGQVYAARGFRDMVHFTVGGEGKKQLSSFLQLNQIKYYELRGFKNDMPAPDWFNVISMPDTSREPPSEFLSTMQAKIKELGKAFIPHLMKVNMIIDNVPSINHRHLSQASHISPCRQTYLPLNV